MIFSSEYVSNFMREVQHIPEDLAAARKDKYENFQRNDFKLLESDRAVFDWACKQTYIAIGNILTAAAQIRIDSCPIEGFDRDRLEQILFEEGVYWIKTGLEYPAWPSSDTGKTIPGPKTR